MAPQIVITTGTFLRGRCFLGRKSFAAGRLMRTALAAAAAVSQVPVPGGGGGTGTGGGSATSASGASNDNDDSVDTGGEIEPPSIGLALTLER
jgi:tRNA U34 5-carboxymethylaminomethyl modifying enzyme MnmG/GidA